MDFRDSYAADVISTHGSALDSCDVDRADDAACRRAAKELATLNLAFEGQPVHRIVRDALAHAQRPILSSSFGPDSAALLRLVHDVRGDVPVLWIDSGFNTSATQRFAEGLRREWSLDLRVYRPALEPAQIIERFGGLPAPGDPEHAQFTDIVKLEPFRRALRELQPDVWLTGIRAEETGYRRGLEIASHGPDGVMKIAPLLHWDAERLAQFLHARDLPNGHDYHDVATGGAQRECGLHDRL